MVALFGRELDDIFAYQTPKVARIKDKKLGFLRWGLLFWIATYILMWQIMYKGEHLDVGAIDGVFRLQLQEPTENACNAFTVGCNDNFTIMRDLPYCSQNPSKPTTGKLPCQYWDSEELVQQTEKGLMVPTRIATFKQYRGCRPSVANGWSCNGVLYDFLDRYDGVQREIGPAEPLQEVFVADVERYTLLIDHSFRRHDGRRVKHEGKAMVGHWLECTEEQTPAKRCTEHKLPCAHSECPKEALEAQHEARRALRADAIGSSASLTQIAGKGRGKPHEEAATLKAIDVEKEEPSLVQKLQTVLFPNSPVTLRNGDAFQVGQLLSIAHAELDSYGEKEKDIYRHHGMVLVLQIDYSNLGPWMGFRVTPWRTGLTGPTPHYKIRVTTRPAFDYKVRTLSGDPDDEIRKVREFHGIRIVVEQTGTIAVWDTTQLLLILTTSLGLMAVSNYVTDFLAIYCLPKSKAYYRMKYDEWSTEPIGWCKQRKHQEGAPLPDTLPFNTAPNESPAFKLS